MTCQILLIKFLDVSAVLRACCASVHSFLVWVCLGKRLLGYPTKVEPEPRGVAGGSRIPLESFPPAVATLTGPALPVLPPLRPRSSGAAPPAPGPWRGDGLPGQTLFTDASWTEQLRDIIPACGKPSHVFRDGFMQFASKISSGQIVFRADTAEAMVLHTLELSEGHHCQRCGIWMNSPGVAFAHVNGASHLYGLFRSLYNVLIQTGDDLGVDLLSWLDSPAVTTELNEGELPSVPLGSRENVYRRVVPYMRAMDSLSQLKKAGR
ncbi:hypothetical protein PAPYR_11410 [Paratrimastix pyriformis]|uniref:Uncharacterized protein n=1 Tax=Paratrimastix pyriformis TaxID=342808 RepID=A0ABQ8U3S8_9EUKA|nr:hypothetical protein PAPYR_11410 [Paratrimastix pyriformis]